MTLDQDIRIATPVTTARKIGTIITPGLNIGRDLSYDISLIEWINYNIDQGNIDVTGASLGAVVTVDGTQTITGNKTFSGTSTFSGAVALDGGLTMDTNKFTVADTSGNVVMAGTVTASNATVTLSGIPTYADDAAAGAGGLTAGRVYKVATGELRIKV